CISGQFFRQFAVTIAVSTIISAINALTMTPSRAVLIFKSEEEHDKAAQRHSSEAARITAPISRSGEPSRTESGTSGQPKPPDGAARLAAPTHKREALPWWFFAIIGGLLTWSWGPDFGDRLGLPVPPAQGDEVISQTWAEWGEIFAIYFTPGMLIG